MPSVGSTTMLLPRYPMRTVPAATTLPTGRSDGSLQVIATSPLEGRRKHMDFDIDTVDPGTTCRWPVGLSAAGRKKVDVIRETLARDYPRLARPESR